MALSRELGINPKTVAKWRNRQTVEDRKTGPKELETYSAARTLVVAEGSTVHGRQLLGRVSQDVVILNRRIGLRAAIMHLRPRVARLAYSEATAHEISFLGLNQNPVRYAALSIMDPHLIQDTFEAVGVDLSTLWNDEDYLSARAADIIAWLSDIFSNDMEEWMKPHNSGAHLQSQLKATGLESFCPNVQKCAEIQ